MFLIVFSHFDKAFVLLCFIIAGAIGSPQGLLTTAALLKGTLKVCTEGRFEFPFQIPCQDSQLVWKFETSQYYFHFCKLCTCAGRLYWVVCMQHASPSKTQRLNAGP